MPSHGLALIAAGALGGLEHLPKDQADLLQGLRRHAGRSKVGHEPTDVDLVDLADRPVAEYWDDVNP